MFELLELLINQFNDVNIQNDLGFILNPENSFIIGREEDGFPHIPYFKGVFKKQSNPNVFLELFLETIGFFPYQNRVQIKTSNNFALENVICVDFFEYDGENWRYFPAFDMNAIAYNFDAEYEKHSEILTPVVIQQIFNYL